MPEHTYTESVAAKLEHVPTATDKHRIIYNVKSI
jgi:hypothetical protein